MDALLFMVLAQVIGIAALIAVVLLAVDRMVARGWFDRRAPRERPVIPATSGSGFLGAPIDVFQPNHVHLTAEQARQQADIQHAEDAAPPIDLDSGRGRIDPRERPSNAPSSLRRMPSVISQLVIDSSDPHALAAWWREVLDWTYVWEPAEDDEEIEI